MRSDIQTSGRECVRFAKQVRELCGKVRGERGSVREVIAVDDEQLATSVGFSQTGGLNSNPEELCQVGAGDLSKHVALCEALPFNQSKKFNCHGHDDYHICKEQHAHPEYIFVHSQFYIRQRVYALFRVSIDCLFLSIGRVVSIHVYHSQMSNLNTRQKREYSAPRDGQKRTPAIRCHVTAQCLHRARSLC